MASADFVNQKIKIENTIVAVKKKLHQSETLKVFEVEDTQKHQTNYTLKVYTLALNNNAQKSACLQELNLYKQFSHKNLIKLKAYQEQINNTTQTYTIYFLLETLNSINIVDYFKGSVKPYTQFPLIFSEFQIWNLIYSITQALNYLHLYRYIHKAVRLENIYVYEDGTYKLSEVKYMKYLKGGLTGNTENSNSTNIYNSPNNFSNNNNNNNNNNKAFFENKLDEIFNSIPSIRLEYRSPEEINIYNSPSISEKIDIYCLGVCVFYIMFRVFPNIYISNLNNNNSNFNINTILNQIDGKKQKNEYSLSLIELVTSMLSPFIEERVSAFDILKLIETKVTKGDINFFKNINNRNYDFSFLDINKTQDNSNIYMKLVNTVIGFKPKQSTSTRFIIHRLCGITESEIPNIEYLKYLVINCWKNKDKQLSKTFKTIMSLPILYSPLTALNALSTLDHLIFLSPNVYSKYSYDFFLYLEFFSNVWSIRANRKMFDPNYSINDKQIADFITNYSDMIKNKIRFYSKYQFLECNFTLDFNQEFSSDADYKILLEKTFINDLLNLYNSITQKFGLVPIDLQPLTPFWDLILQIINEQLVTMCKFIYIILFAYKNFFSTQINKLMIYDKRFFETTNRIIEYINKYNKRRRDYNSQYLFFNVQDFFIENLNYLTERLRNFPNENFRLRLYFEDTKSYCGVQTHLSINKIIEKNLFQNYKLNMINNVDDFNYNTNNLNINNNNMSKPSLGLSFNNISEGNIGNKSVIENSISKSNSFHYNNLQNMNTNINYSLNNKNISNISNTTTNFSNSTNKNVVTNNSNKTDFNSLINKIPGNYFNKRATSNNNINNLQSNSYNQFNQSNAIPINSNTRNFDNSLLVNLNTLNNNNNKENNNLNMHSLISKTSMNFPDLKDINSKVSLNNEDRKNIMNNTSIIKHIPITNNDTKINNNNSFKSPQPSNNYYKNNTNNFKIPLIDNNIINSNLPHHHKNNSISDSTKINEIYNNYNFQQSQIMNIQTTQKLEKDNSKASYKLVIGEIDSSETNKNEDLKTKEINTTFNNRNVSKNPFNNTMKASDLKDLNAAFKDINIDIDNITDLSILNNASNVQTNNNHQERYSMNNTSNKNTNDLFKELIKENYSNITHNNNNNTSNKTDNLSKGIASNQNNAFKDLNNTIKSRKNSNTEFMIDKKESINQDNENSKVIIPAFNNNFSKQASYFNTKINSNTSKSSSDKENISNEHNNKKEFDYISKEVTSYFNNNENKANQLKAADQHTLNINNDASTINAINTINFDVSNKVSPKKENIRHEIIEENNIDEFTSLENFDSFQICNKSLMNMIDNHQSQLQSISNDVNNSDYGNIQDNQYLKMFNNNIFNSKVDFNNNPVNNNQNTETVLNSINKNSNLTNINTNAIPNINIPYKQQGNVNDYNNLRNNQQQNNNYQNQINPNTNNTNLPHNINNYYVNNNNNNNNASRNNINNSTINPNNAYTNFNNDKHIDDSNIDQNMKNANYLYLMYNNPYFIQINQGNQVHHNNHGIIPFNNQNNNNFNQFENMEHHPRSFNDIGEMMSSFLQSEVSKRNNYIINSKDIQLGKQIGFGGTSEVYKGIFRGSEVAVKKLRILDLKDDKIKEFKREVSSLTLMRHPFLVLFMGAIAENDNISIVTEFCAGGTLFKLLHSREMIFPWELRVKILHDIAVGMNFLHTNNPPIIHRDLKSLNILLTDKVEKVTDTTKIKISDFGLSKIIEKIDSGNFIPMTGQLGTCHWMAPEVIDNKQYTLKADVYSYGIMVWEICTRRTPYEGKSQQEIALNVTGKKMRPDKSFIPLETPHGLRELMEFCWDHDPINRPNFEQIRQLLSKILGSINEKK